MFQCHHGVPASLPTRIHYDNEITVSMPPRRSCFRYAYGSGRRIPVFQCHHGVPASRAGVATGGPQKWFQCHHGVPASESSGSISTSLAVFQCHHGVPASPKGIDDALLARTRFNATTAFLLRGMAEGRGGGLHHVSMPPRRSCFGAGRPDRGPGGRVSMPPRRSCFDPDEVITTSLDFVSMPPRRSCFDCPTSS